jgi:hypothetical protein
MSVTRPPIEAQESSPVLVVLVLGESRHRGVVQRVIGIEKRDDRRCVEND